MTEASQALGSVVIPILERQGLLLYDLDLTGTEGRARTLRVLVQSRDGAPSTSTRSRPRPRPCRRHSTRTPTRPECCAVRTRSR